MQLKFSRHDGFLFPMKDMLKYPNFPLKMNSILNSGLKNAEVLDLGCGDGTLLAGLRKP